MMQADHYAAAAGLASPEASRLSTTPDIGVERQEWAGAGAGQTFSWHTSPSCPAPRSDHQQITRPRPTPCRQPMYWRHLTGIVMLMRPSRLPRITAMNTQQAWSKVIAMMMA
jgi:hypothetical protein